MTTLRWVLALAATTSLATAQTVTVLQYGPADYTSGTTVAHNRVATASAGSTVMAFNTTTPLSPAANYTGPVYYGGAQWSNDQNVNRNFTRNQLRHDTPGGANLGNSILTFSVSTTATTFTAGTGAAAAAIVFPQSSFINGGNSGAVALNSLAAVVLGQSTTPANTQVRWLVQTAAGYYVSNASSQWAFTSPTTFTTTSLALSSGDLATTLWAPYNPVASLNFDQAAAAFSAIDLSSLTGVGLYFEVDTFSLPQAGSGQIMSFGMRELSAVGTIVPETGTYAAIFGALGLAAVVAVRRRKL